MPTSEQCSLLRQPRTQTNVPPKLKHKFYCCQINPEHAVAESYTITGGNAIPSMNVIFFSIELYRLYSNPISWQILAINQ